MKQAGSMLDGGEQQRILAEIGCLKDVITERDVNIVQLGVKHPRINGGRLIDMLCNRTKKQLTAIDELHREKEGSCLVTMVTDNVRGYAGKAIGYSLMETDARGAEFFSIGTEGSGTKEHVLIDLVNTNTNAQLAAIRKKLEAKNGKTMVECLDSELSGNARKMMDILFFGKKSESENVDPVLATQQAEALHKASVQKLIDTDHDVFLDILGSQSRAQIQAIKTAYEKNHGMSLKSTITTGCCSGTYQKFLLACLLPTSEAYTASAFFEAMDGAGTRDNRVARLLGGTQKSKMAAVESCYQVAHRTSLVRTLKGDLSGTFLKAALGLITGTDPTKGMESVTTEALASDDPSIQEGLLGYLIQERDNLKYFSCKMDAEDICQACKGMGTRNSQLSSVVCGRTKPHLAKVDKEYQRMFDKSLEEEVRSECSGAYRDFLVYAVLPEADVAAIVLDKAMGMLSTNKGLIISTLAPQSNARILAAKAQYDQKYRKPLIDRLNSALSGTLKDLVLALIKGERQEDKVDEGLAAEQAKELYNAGIGKGSDEKAFIRILSQASRPQIELIRQHYQSNHGMRLERAIELEKEFDDSFKTMLLTIIKEPAAYYAHELNAAFTCKITDTDTVARILGGNNEAMVDQIAERYQDNYQDTLVADVKRKISNKNVRHAVLTWLGTCSSAHTRNKDGSCAKGEVVMDRQEKENLDPVPRRLPEPSAAADEGASPSVGNGDDGDGSSEEEEKEKEEGKGSVHGIADEGAVPLAFRRGDVSNRGHSREGVAPPGHRGTQSTTLPPPPTASYVSPAPPAGRGTTTSVDAPRDQDGHHDNGNNLAKAFDGLSVNGPWPYGDGSPEKEVEGEERKGSVHRIPDEGAVPPFIRLGDVSNRGRSGEGVASPGHWGSQSCQQRPPPPTVYYTSSTSQAKGGTNSADVLKENTEHPCKGSKSEDNKAEHQNGNPLPSYDEAVKMHDDDDGSQSSDED